MLAAIAKTSGLVVSKEALSLYRLALLQKEGSLILEIVSYRGASTTAIGHAIKDGDIELYCLDYWMIIMCRVSLMGCLSTKCPLILRFSEVFLPI